MRLLPRLWRLALLVVALGLLAGCEVPGFGMPDPASEEGETIFGLWKGFALAALAVGAIVWGLLVYCLIRFRRRNDDVPAQRPYNIPIEILYTAAPVAVVAVLFGFSVAAENDVTSVDDPADVKVDVIGFQWSWQFVYPDEGVTITGDPGSPPELVLPVDEVIHLRLISHDVNHSFWVPDFLSKRDLIPGVDNEIQVEPNKLGTYDGRCAEFCGLDHWRMNYTVRVVTADQYQDWLTIQKAAA